MNLQSMALRFSDRLEILDQTLLPHEEKWITITSTDQMINAIKNLQVRGAPLIGVAAALQLAQAAEQDFNIDRLMNQAQALYEARPTAVNLMNCIDRMKKSLADFKDKHRFIQTAMNLFDEDVDLCEKISQYGSRLIDDGDSVLTHCNTGGLATAGVGTALGIIRKAHESGKKIHVYVDETRPLLQGSRLTAWELQKIGVPCTLITDSMAAQLMSQKKINKAFVGSDRIAANGDFANKIGTYSVAVNCHYHRIPFYVAAPFTTVDPHCPSGQMIPIEQRSAKEVLTPGKFKVNVYNPAFDVTPAELTTAWIVDRGVYNQTDIAKGCFS